MLIKSCLEQISMNRFFKLTGLIWSQTKWRNMNLWLSNKSCNPVIGRKDMLKLDTRTDGWNVNMTLNNEPVKYDQLSEGFAEFFEKKVGDIVKETVVNPRVYNGGQKIYAESSAFMTRDNILECMNGLKLKNTEGYDRIPQRILIDGRDL